MTRGNPEWLDTATQPIDMHALMAEQNGVELTR